jgi:hypothetical protein
MPLSLNSEALAGEAAQHGQHVSRDTISCQVSREHHGAALLQRIDNQRVAMRAGCGYGRPAAVDAVRARVT